MYDYDAPDIIDRRSLDGSLTAVYRSKEPSDAEIKHGVRSVAGYQAPEITAERSLDAKLISLSELNETT